MMFTLHPRYYKVTKKQNWKLKRTKNNNEKGRLGSMKSTSKYTEITVQPRGIEKSTHLCGWDYETHIHTLVLHTLSKVYYYTCYWK